MEHNFVTSSSRAFSWLMNRKRKRRARQTPSPQPEQTPRTLSPLLPGLIASASTVGDNPMQQDAHSSVSLPGCKLAVIADGVSFHPFSTVFAPFAVSTLVAHLHRLVITYPEPLTRDQAINAVDWAFRRTNRDLLRFKDMTESTLGKVARSTLFACLETPDCFVVAGSGDGGIYHVDPVGEIRNLHVATRANAAFGMEERKPRFAVIDKEPGVGNLIVMATDGMAISVDYGDGLERSSVEQMVPYLLDDISHHYFQKSADQLQSELYLSTVQHSLEAWVRSPSAEVKRVDQLYNEAPQAVREARDNRTLAVISDDEFIRQMFGESDVAPE